MMRLKVGILTLYRGVEDARIGDFFDDETMERINRYLPRDYLETVTKKTKAKAEPANPPDQRTQINRELRKKMYELSGEHKLLGKYLDRRTNDLLKLVFNPLHYGFPEADFAGQLADFIYVMDFNGTLLDVMDFNGTLLDPHLKGFKVEFHRAWEEADTIRILHFQAQKRDKLAIILEESGGHVDHPGLAEVLEDLGELYQTRLLQVSGSEVAVLLEQAILLSGADPEKVVEMINWGAMDLN